MSAHPSPAEGYIVISPASTNLREIVFYTAKGTDGNGTYITVTLANRGLGGTTAQTHAIGEPVRMNVSAETIQEISDALDQIVAGGAQDASTVTKGIARMSVAPAVAATPIAVGDNDPRVPTADPTTLFIAKTQMKFGGTGADGALTVASGTTDIDLGGAQVVIKNYTSISITGTGKVTFSNPHTNGTTVVFKSQGNVTLTSSEAPMIDASGIGSSANVDGHSFNIFRTNKGNTSPAWNDGGDGGALPTFNATNAVKSPLSGKYNMAAPGAGGAGGGAGNSSGGGGGASFIAIGTDGGTGTNSGAGTNVGGVGGRGGGVLIIECAGAWNFTTASGVSVAGKNGGNATNGTGVSSGGGGGGGGVFIGLYNTLTANTGTITVSGGTGGGGSSSAFTGGGGGNGGVGYSLVASNTEFL